MAKLTDQELKALLAAEKTDSLQSFSATQLSADRSDALSYYLGDVSKDMASIAGRSQVVSTDVADTIEGLMPSLMEIFAGSEDAIAFDPVGSEDIAAAEQETAYVQHVFWQLNDGYVVLHNFIKDALLSKLGIVKVWWNEEEKEERETYLDQSPDEYALISTSQEVEVVEHTEHDGLHDVTVAYAKTHAQAKCEGVPPEEFGVARRSRNIRDSHYCYHEVVRSQSELLDDGYDYDQVEGLDTYNTPRSSESQARDTVNEDDENEGDSAGLNKAMRPLRVTEHYIRMDYEGDDKACLYRVVTGGEDGVILKRDDEPAVEKIDFIPFAVMTPIIMPHRMFGLSIADRVMDIQRVKTALQRAYLDNLYLANNPRTVVIESLAGDSTIDDLLVSRPGGIVRAKNPGAVEALQHPDIGPHVLPALQYWDATREWRTGVTRQGQGLDADALNNQTATAAHQLYNAAQARMKLVARNFAETGIKDLFWLIHAVIRKNANQQAMVRLNSNWVPIDPRNWKTRNDVTVSVGLGQGGKAERVQQQMMLIGMQKEALLNGLGQMVPPKKLYNSAKEICKLLETDVELYFTDPGDAPLPPPPPDPEMMKMQAQAEIEKTQAQADIATQQQKTQAEMELASQKFELDKQLALLNHGLKVEEARVKHVGTALSLAGKANGTGPDGEATGPDPAMVAQVMEGLKPKEGAVRLRKVGPNEWVKEPIQ